MLPLYTVASCVLLLVGLYRFVVYPAFLSPLAKVPSPNCFASFSPAWILFRRWQGKENRSIFAAHQKCGPIVRLGPNELSVNSIEGLRTVYKGGFERHVWFERGFANYGIPNMVSTLQSKPHSERKRMMSNVYSKSTIQASTELREISREIIHDRLLPILQSAATRGTPTDILELTTAYSMDFTSAYLLGAAKATNFLQDVDQRKRALRLYRCRKPSMFWATELPTLTKTLGHVGIPVVPRPIADATEELEDWFLKLCNDATQVGKEIPSGAMTYKQLALGLEKFPFPGQAQDRVIASELLDHAIAGFETNGIVLTYATWELSQRPDMVKALREEMLTLSPPLRFPMHEGDDLPTPRSIDNLRLLNAVVQETLRLYPPSPGPQPRVTPATPSTILGYDNIPGNVRISSNSYSLHRNEEVYPEPEKWKPERWLEENKEAVDERYRLFWTFGSGGRMCIGSHFALQLLKLAMVAIYTNFETSIVDDTGIEQVDSFIAGPVADKLILAFKPAVGE
ncbi:hypothetical protein MMC32_006879 [Xylographa parallela]|nr:hypothetical protein [Xylographa parallela]